MKAKPQMTIEIIESALRDFDLSTARLNLSSLIGASISISGQILKVIKRNENLKLFIQTENLQAFAEFNGKPEEKFRKGQKVKVKGNFQTFGTSAITINGARIIKYKEKNASL